MIALAAGLLLRFGAKEAAVIFFGYSKGFYGMVLVLSALSYLAVFFINHQGMVINWEVIRLNSLNWYSEIMS